MNRRGVTLIELLVALIISSIAMMALVIPFVAERAFLGSGKAQAEAQRDTEMVLRAIARAARQSDAVDPGTFIPGPNGQIQFNNPITRCFQANTATGKLFMTTPGGPILTSCGAGGPQPGVELIDGNRSRVTNFSPLIVNSKLVRVHLEVTHTPIVGGPRQEKEVLETEIFLRNGS